jgi:hypothetical protein
MIILAVVAVPTPTLRLLCQHDDPIDAVFTDRMKRCLAGVNFLFNTILYLCLMQNTVCD